VTAIGVGEVNRVQTPGSQNWARGGKTQYAEAAARQVLSYHRCMAAKRLEQRTTQN